MENESNSCCIAHTKKINLWFIEISGKSEENMNCVKIRLQKLQQKTLQTWEKKTYT